MQLRSTSTQRTYRYVRLCLVGVVVLIGAAVTAQVVSGGLLGSVSAAYYTPARNAFVGGLCAVALALLALSGRSVEQILLDLAAVLAPVIAFVPAPIGPGDVPGLAVACPGEGRCVPAGAVPEVGNGMIALSVVGLAGLAAAVVLAVVQGTSDRAHAAGLGAAGVLIVGGILWGMLAPESFLAAGHLAATIGFFALIGAVAALAAVRPAASGARRRGRRVGYAVIAAGIAASLVFLLVVTATAAPTGLIFIGEAAALLLFAAFWTVQTVEVWRDPDPRLRAGIVAPALR